MFRILAAGLCVAAAVGLSVPANAQNASQNEPVQLTEQHLDMARKVFIASKTGRSFDQILPTIADRAKTTFVRSNPQIQLGVIEAVDRVALELVPRRLDLDSDLIRIWALAFTEEELAVLLQFYQTPAGQKFTEIQPKLISTQLAAAENWTTEISQELTRRTRRELQKMVKQDAQNLRGSTSESTGQ